MTISELIASLEAVKAEHGNLLVLADNAEADYDEHKYLFVGDFVPSGNRYCGGDWAAASDGKKRSPSDTKCSPTRAAYLSTWHLPTVAVA